MNANRTSRPIFAVVDFCKLFFYALACGTGFSLCAAAITLVLVGVAEASTPRLATVEVVAATARPHPGVLMVGEGCENEPIMAVERDWQIRINDRTAEVRVTQKFVLPEEGVASAGFDFVPPTGATLKAFSIENGGNVLTGQLVSAGAFVGTTREKLQQLAKRNRLLVWIGEDGIHTDQMLNLRGNETVTIAYRYEMPITSGAGFQVLQLALHPVAIEDTDAVKYWSAVRPNLTSGTVKVEWLGVPPLYLIRQPVDAHIERNHKGIVGLNWFADDLIVGATLVLSWAQG